MGVCVAFATAIACAGCGGPRLAKHSAPQPAARVGSVMQGFGGALPILLGVQSSELRLDPAPDVSIPAGYRRYHRVGTLARIYLPDEPAAPDAPLLLTTSSRLRLHGSYLPTVLTATLEGERVDGQASASFDDGMAWLALIASSPSAQVMPWTEVPYSRSKYPKGLFERGAALHAPGEVVYLGCRHQRHDDREQIECTFSRFCRFWLDGKEQRAMTSSTSEPRCELPVHRSRHTAPNKHT